MQTMVVVDGSEDGLRTVPRPTHMQSYHIFRIRSIGAGVTLREEVELDAPIPELWLAEARIALLIRREAGLYEIEAKREKIEFPPAEDEDRPAEAAGPVPGRDFEYPGWES